MFDIGFSEMMVIAVVALVVIGPERLPKLARTLGHLTGRMQRYVNDVKADINREIELDELRKFKQEIQTSAQTFESTVKAELRKTEDVFSSAAQDVSHAVESVAAAVSPAPVSQGPGNPAPGVSSDTHIAAGPPAAAAAPVSADAAMPLAEPPLPTTAPGPLVSGPVADGPKST